MYSKGEGEGSGRREKVEEMERKYSGVGNDRKGVREEIGGTSRATRAETTLGDERETRVEEGERERERDSSGKAERRT